MLFKLVAETTVAAAEEGVKMDTTTSAICLAGFVLGLIAAVVLVFLGFKGVNCELKKDDATHVVPKNVLVRSTLFLVGAVFAIVICHFASNYKVVYEGTHSATELFLACLISIAKKFGWIAAIPWVMSLFRKQSLGIRRGNDTDKM
ncbi:MAG: hypothetical protein IK109_01230 [Clostridiales bacterium]|nr:hypothetical protein [Clostridiales bacterium]